jgi:hypothetical protein
MPRKVTWKHGGPRQARELGKADGFEANYRWDADNDEPFVVEMSDADADKLINEHPEDAKAFRFEQGPAPVVVATEGDATAGDAAAGVGEGAGGRRGR